MKGSRRAPLLRRLVDVMLRRRAVHRPALVRETNLPLQVIADLLAELESRGLVVVNGRFTGMPGRSNLTYALADGAAAAIAIRLEPHWLESALCDLRGALLASTRAPRRTAVGIEIADDIENAVRLACRQAGIERFRVGAVHLSLAPGETGYDDLAEAAAARLGCSVSIETETDETPSPQLPLAHRGLLAALFGEPSD